MPITDTPSPNGSPPITPVFIRCEEESRVNYENPFTSSSFEGFSGCQCENRLALRERNTAQIMGLPRNKYEAMQQAIIQKEEYKALELIYECFGYPKNPAKQFWHDYVTYPIKLIAHFFINITFPNLPSSAIQRAKDELLYLAIQSEENLKICEELIALNADCNYVYTLKNEQGVQIECFSTLQAAVCSNSLEAVKLLVRSGAKVKKVGNISPLSVAISQVNIELVEYLLDHSSCQKEDLDTLEIIECSAEDKEKLKRLLSKEKV